MLKKLLYAVRGLEDMVQEIEQNVAPLDSCWNLEDHDPDFDAAQAVEDIAEEQAAMSVAWLR